MQSRSSLIALVLLCAPAFANDVTPPQPKEIELAICLDVSGSMNGLINSARAKLWAIVNDLALAKPTPKLRVALVTFGRKNYPAAKGWVQVDANLTDDLDLISQKLFGLSTNGGEEYVGRVLQTALDELTWSKKKDTLRLIIVAGNESADQDKQVNYRDICKRAITGGTMVNAIYCGPKTDDIAAGWKDVALRADGHFHTIDQNRGTVTIDTPFDARLAELTASINKTYIPLVSEGRRGWANQKAQDRNAARLGKAVEAQRQSAKASKLYFCRWCLVDAYRNKEIKLAEIKKEDLPKELQDKSEEELKKHIDATYKKREQIQKEINELNKLRSAYVTGEMKKKNLSEDKAFDKAVRSAIRSQAKQKGYAFPEESK